MISCQDAVRRLWEYVEREANEAERAALEEHLALCLRCCGEAAFTAELRAFLAGHARAEVPADVQARLSGLIDGLEESR